jgi:hypothetical protein
MLLRGFFEVPGHHESFVATPITTATAPATSGQAQRRNERALPAADKEFCFFRWDIDLHRFDESIQYQLSPGTVYTHPSEVLEYPYAIPV